MVVGGLPAAAHSWAARRPGRQGPRGARERVADRLAELVPYALEHGVRLVLEPLHPMYAADRAVLSTLGQALDLAAPHPADAVGVVVDTFHVWWDPAAGDPDRAGRRARAGSRPTRSATSTCRSPPTPCSPAG